jgi:tellurite resistance protein TerB
MGVLDWLKTQATSIQDEVKKFKNKNFMEAAVAGCALVAAADGVIKPEEKAKMAGFIQRNDALKVFDMSQVIQAFEKFTQGLEFDHTIGKGEALKAISKIKKSSDEARLLVRVCCAIGAADGDFDEDEKKTVREVCYELGLDPKEFGLEEASGPSLRK